MSASRRAFAWVALGVACFTVYGSLVPFQFRARSISTAIDAYQKELSSSVKIVSRSDAAANVMLGVPLGFTLLGFVCADRNWHWRKSARFGLLLVPVCGIFSAAVEFAQLFTLTRNCAASDILAQVLGALVGMIAWILFGQKFADRVRAVWKHADLNATGRILIAYLAILVFIQTLPFDVSVSPYALYRKLFRSDWREGGVLYIPFDEFSDTSDAKSWEYTAKLARLAALFFPVGLLVGLLKGRTERWSLVRVALTAFALAVGVELLQLLVSRTPSMTDVIVGACAMVVGWFAARVHHEGLAIPFALSWFIVWLAMMTPITQPHASSPRLETPRPFDWMPGLPLESGDPFLTLEEMLTKLVLFGLLGVLVAAWRLPPRTRRSPSGSLRVAIVIATVLGLLMASIFENSQRWSDLHTPCITDVMLGGLGAALGVLVASRAMFVRQAAGQITLDNEPRPQESGKR